MTEDVRFKIAQFFSRFTPKTYKKGEIIIRADDTPTQVFYLEQGTVRAYAISQKGEELVVTIFKPFSFFPMSQAVNQTPNNYYYEAMDEVILRKAPTGDVILFIKDNPEILFDLLSRVYKGVEGMMTRMTYLMGESAYKRLLIELVIHAKRFGEKKNEGVEITLSEKEIAAQSGLTRETVSREIKHLKDKQLIRFEKNTLHINDITALETEISKGF